MGYVDPTRGRELPFTPALASWDRAGTPGQTRLATLLSDLTDWLGPLPSGPLVLSLAVGLPAKMPLASRGHDLDNYLFPIAQHLGSDRFVAALAKKGHATSSYLAIEPAQPITDDTWRPKLAVRTSSSTDGLGWKQEIGQACAEQVGTPPGQGPLRLEVHYRLNSRRNWASLWKPTIDALGPILGAPDPRRPYNVNDDRITDLRLTRTVDDEFGWEVQVEADWVVLRDAVVDTRVTTMAAEVAPASAPQEE